MQSSLDRFIRKRQAPAESNCGEEEECQEKEPKTTEDMEDSSSWKRYEEKRKQEGRSFRQEWKKTFAWLQFDETKQEMFKACTSTTIIHPKLYVNLKNLHKCLMRK